MQREAPSHRIAAEGERGWGVGEHVLHAAGEGDRAGRAALLAVPGEVERDGAVAFCVQMRDDAVPRATGAAEAMQEDGVLRHGGIVGAA